MTDPSPSSSPAFGEPAYAQSSAAPGGKTNTLAIVSLVASIAGFVIWGVGFIVGIITGHIALNQIKKTGENGAGMAKAGLIVGYVGVALTVIAVILVIVITIAAVNAGVTTTY